VPNTSAVVPPTGFNPRPRSASRTTCRWRPSSPALRGFNPRPRSASRTTPATDRRRGPSVVSTRVPDLHRGRPVMERALRRSCKFQPASPICIEDDDPLVRDVRLGWVSTRVPDLHRGRRRAARTRAGCRRFNPRPRSASRTTRGRPRVHAEIVVSTRVPDLHRGRPSSSTHRTPISMFQPASPICIEDDLGISAMAILLRGFNPRPRSASRTTYRGRAARSDQAVSTRVPDLHRGRRPRRPWIGWMARCFNPRPRSASRTTHGPARGPIRMQVSTRVPDLHRGRPRPPKLAIIKT
jgi:hypothetical protein